MSLAALAPFVGSICDSRLLEPEQQRELLDNLQAKFPDPRALARELIGRGWLTPYQVNQIAQGRGPSLSMDQYVLLERLGEGGMGQVFTARQRSLGRVVAIKIIRPEQTANATAVRRFRREAEVAARLDHPNIVHVFDAGEASGTWYLAMEYVEGRDLARILAESGAVPVPLACEYVRQAALGLQHAHEKGMVHRDVKPSNLLVASGPKPVVKLLDLGLARLRPLDQDDVSFSSVTQAGVVVGTLDYMAPEQAKNSHAADARADLYSLGCTFYHLLADRPPFAKGTGMEKLLQHQLDAPPPVEQMRPETPPAVARLVHRLLEKKPEMRPQTASKVAAALEPFCDGRAKPKAGKRKSPRMVDVLAPTLEMDRGIPEVTPVREETVWVLPASDTPKSKPRRARWWLPVAGIVCGLLVLLCAGAVLQGIAKRAKGTQPAVAPPEPITWRTLERLLPDDTILAVRIDVRQLREAPQWRERFERDARELLQGGGAAGWAKDVLGVDLAADVDRVLFVQDYRDTDRPLVLLAGRFDRNRFRIGENGLHPLEGTPARYEFREADRPTTHVIALRDDLLAVTAEPELAAETAERMGGRRKMEFKSPKMAELLAQADESRPVSVAGVGAAPASWDLFKGKPEFGRAIVRSWGFSGSVTAGEDVVAEVVCRPIAEDAKPDLLVPLLDTTRRIVGGLLRFQEGFRGEPRLSRKLLENAEMSRQEGNVVIRSRVTTADLIRPRRKPN